MQVERVCNALSAAEAEAARADAQAQSHQARCVEAVYMMDAAHVRLEEAQCPCSVDCSSVWVCP
jgi:hypothetical protein